MQATLHRAGIDLGQAHATAGHLGLRVALISRPWQRPAYEKLDERGALFAPEIGRRARGIDAGVVEEHGREPVRKPLPHDADHAAISGTSERAQPVVGATLAPADGDAREIRAPRLRADGDVRNIEHGWAAVSAMREEKAAGRACRALRRARGERHWKRDSCELCVRGWIGGEWCEGGIRHV